MNLAELWYSAGAGLFRWKHLCDLPRRRAFLRTTRHRPAYVLNFSLTQVNLRHTSSMPITASLFRTQRRPHLTTSHHNNPPTWTAVLVEEDFGGGSSTLSISQEPSPREAGTSVDLPLAPRRPQELLLIIPALPAKMQHDTRVRTWTWAKCSLESFCSCLRPIMRTL